MTSTESNFSKDSVQDHMTRLRMKMVQQKIANEKDKLNRPSSADDTDDEVEHQAKLQQALLRRQELLERIKQEQLMTEDTRRPRTYSARRRYTPSPAQPPPSRRSLPDYSQNRGDATFRNTNRASNRDLPQVKHIIEHRLQTPSRPYHLPPIQNQGQAPAGQAPAVPQVQGGQGQGYQGPVQQQQQPQPQPQQSGNMMNPAMVVMSPAQPQQIISTQPIVHNLVPQGGNSGGGGGFGKGDFMEMMMMQNAQMHHLVMQQMMLGNVTGGSMGGMGGGGGRSMSVPVMMQQESAPSPIMMRAPSQQAVHHHHYQSAAPVQQPMVSHYQTLPPLEMRSMSPVRVMRGGGGYSRGYGGGGYMQDNGSNYYVYH